MAGEIIFHAAGCASCHSESEDKDPRLLSGGLDFVSDFGTFYAPNISPSEQGLKGWTVLDLANALRHGTSPNKKHYYPAFPYTAYQHMADQDVANLYAYLMTLPPSSEPSKQHDVGFPFSIRRGLGAWKLLFFKDEFALKNVPSAEVERGRYLVEALGHCGECHTPRGVLGQLDNSRWLQGAPNPSGKGRIPGLAAPNFDWDAADIAYYLETGLTPDFDSTGGKMADVVDNMAKLTPEDREAIAAYLKSIPALP